MMKPLILSLGLLSIAACTTMEQREARCKCFNSDGSASGLCNFEALPGEPAVFSFVEVSRASAGSLRSSARSDQIRKELCGG